MSHSLEQPVDAALQHYQERRVEERLADTLGSYREFASATWETYEFFGLDEGMTDEAAIRKEQKHAFMLGSIRNPELNYPKLCTTEFVDQLSIAEYGLMALGTQLDEINAESDRVRVARELPEQRHLELMMLDIAGRFARNEVTEAERHDYIELFNKINDELYGEVEETRFAGLWQPVLSQARQIETNPDPVPSEVREAAEYLLENTAHGIDDVPASPPIAVDDETRKQLRTMFERYFADILCVVPQKAPEEKLTTEEFSQMFRDAHARMGTGWSVMSEPGKKTMDTRQSTRTTVIGDERPVPNVDGARGIFTHEFCIHVLRRHFGDQLGDPLLAGTGLAGYIPNEEGAGRISEQIMNGKPEVPGEKYYSTLGMARGVDGGPKRDFRDVFEIEWRRRLLSKYTKQAILPENAVDKAKDEAYTTCLRIFRGTVCNEPGMVFAKDIGYYDGGQNMWPYFVEIAQGSLAEQSDSLDLFLAAKYDPLHPVQRRVVEQALARSGIDKSIKK